MEGPGETKPAPARGLYAKVSVGLTVMGWVTGLLLRSVPGGASAWLAAVFLLVGGLILAVVSFWDKPRSQWLTGIALAIALAPVVVLGVFLWNLSHIM